MTSSKRIALIAMFTAIITICSWISIPLTVPITLQTFAVFVTCGVLGGCDGTITVCLYILLGALGLPVFSGFIGGPARLLGPTGGYLIGFILTALIMWAASRIPGNRLFILTASMAIGIIVCYAFGTVWYILVYTGSSSTDILTVLSTCVFPFIIPDIIKIILAVIVTRNLRSLHILI